MAHMLSVPGRLVMPLRRRLFETSAIIAVAALAVTAAPAKAAGFAATANVQTGTVNGGITTLDPGAPVISLDQQFTVIRWDPSDTNGAGAVNLLPAGEQISFERVHADPALRDFTVINRILPTNRSRVVEFNGTVRSLLKATADDAGVPGGKLWFYSPGGLLLGPTARFDIGSLLLTTADPALGTGGPTAVLDGAADSRAAITVQPGAQISAPRGSAGAGDYIALVAPRVRMNGTVTGGGQVAYVAAEDVELTIGRGLFDVAVRVGTSSDASDRTALQHDGTTSVGGDAAAGLAGRIYAVAVPKNSAITMLVGGSMGATSASLSGNAIILSAGSGIAGGTAVAAPAGAPRSDIAAAPAVLTASAGLSLAATGDIAAGNLRAGRSIDVASTRGAVTVGDTDSSGGNVRVTSAGNLSLGNVRAAGSILLTASGAVAAGDLTAGTGRLQFGEEGSDAGGTEAGIAAGFEDFFLARGDDNVANSSLGFEIDYFGNRYTETFVSNNGYITFGGGQTTFTPSGLAEGYSGRPIIAAFFADVDTRNPASAQTGYGTGSFAGRPAFGVTWNGVGYFSAQADKLNRFQLILANRGDTGPGNFDIYFNYTDIQWETGSHPSSGGVNGFGGISAAVGYNAGTGNQPGTFFELPGSRVPGSFLNTGPQPLVSTSNIGVPGQYRFAVRNGVVTEPSSQPAVIAVTNLSAENADGVRLGNLSAEGVEVHGAGPVTVGTVDVGDRARGATGQRFDIVLSTAAGDIAATRLQAGDDVLVNAAGSIILGSAEARGDPVAARDAAGNKSFIRTLPKYATDTLLADAAALGSASDGAIDAVDELDSVLLGVSSIHLLAGQRAAGVDPEASITVAGALRGRGYVTALAGKDITLAGAVEANRFVVAADGNVTLGSGAAVTQSGNNQLSITARSGSVVLQPGLTLQGGALSERARAPGTTIPAGFSDCGIFACVPAGAQITAGQSINGSGASLIAGSAAAPERLLLNAGRDVRLLDLTAARLGTGRLGNPAGQVLGGLDLPGGAFALGGTLTLREGGLRLTARDGVAVDALALAGPVTLVSPADVRLGRTDAVSLPESILADGRSVAAGALAARTDITLIAREGDVSVAGLDAGGNISLDALAGAIAATGSIAAGGAANLNARDAITVGTITTAEGDVTLDAGGSIVAASLSAGDDIEATATSGSLEIARASAVRAAGEGEERVIDLVAGTSIRLDDASAGDDVLLLARAGRISSSGTIEAGDDIAMLALTGADVGTLRTTGAAPDADGFGRSILIAASFDEATLALTPTSDLRIRGGVSAADAFLLGVSGDLVVDSGAAITVGAVGSAVRDLALSARSIQAAGARFTASGDIALTAQAGDLTTGALSAGDDIVLQARGSIMVAGARAGAGDSGGRAAADSHEGDGGTIRASGLDGAPAGGTITLTDVAATGFIDAAAVGDVTIAGPGALSLRAVTSQAGSVAVTGATVAVSDRLTGVTVDLTAADVAIAPSALIGGAATTAVTLTASNAAGDVFVGGSGGNSGFDLSGAELQRIRAQATTVVASSGTGPARNLRIGSLTLTGAQDAQPNLVGDAGSLTLRTAGTAEVLGAVRLENAGANNRISIEAGQRVAVRTPQGQITLTGAGAAPAGVLAIDAPDIIVGSSAIVDSPDTPATLARRGSPLERADGAPREQGFLQAGRFAFTVGRSLLVQNTGRSAQEGGGLTASATVDPIVITPRPGAAAPPLVVLFGRAGNVAGREFSSAITGEVAEGSLFNGCSPDGACGGGDPTRGAAIADSISEAIGETAEDEGGGRPSRLRLSSLFDPTLIEAAPTFSLIEEPVTGAGNDAFWIGTDDPNPDEDE